MDEAFPFFWRLWTDFGSARDNREDVSNLHGSGLKWRYTPQQSNKTSSCRPSNIAEFVQERFNGDDPPPVDLQRLLLQP